MKKGLELCARLIYNVNIQMDITVLEKEKHGRFCITIEMDWHGRARR